MSEKNLQAQFKAPGADFRGKPFWSWNGELKRDELIRQAGIFKEMGFGGYFMHSRTGLITEYLGKDWFELTRAVSDAGQKLGMESWLYDEDRWPSGSAGGKVTEDPALRMKSIYIYEATADKFAWDEDMLCAWEADLDGICMTNARELANGEKPARTHAVWFRIVPDAPDSNYNGNTYIDTMKRAAVDRFLEMTHDRYAEECGDRIGTSIPGIFSDEPHRGACMGYLEEKDGIRSNRIFYTDDIFAEFEKRYGYSAREHLPEIFYRLNGEPVSRVRMDYIDLGCNLFNERFAAPIHEWCVKHNMRFTGHVLHEDSLGNQTAPNGSLMRFYENMDVPGIDILGSGNRCYWAAKQCSSVCRQTGKTRMLSELYGCSGWEFTLRGHKLLGDWQALFGVNLRCPHLSWYTMEGECKRDYPASVSFQSAYCGDYEKVESYYARMGLLLAEGKPQCDLLVLEPIESVWALAHMEWASWIFPVKEDVEAVEKLYEETFAQLAGARLDFDYGEEQMMARMGMVGRDEKGALLRIGKAVYRTLLITGAITVRPSTLALAEDFLKAGGTVVFAGDLPGYVGGEKSDVCEALVQKYGNCLHIAREAMVPALKAMDTSPIRADAGEKVFCQIRRTDFGWASVWLNTDAEADAEPFTIRAALPEGMRAECWDLLSGDRFIYPSEYSEGELTLRCTLEKAATLALVFTENTEPLPVYPTAAPIETGKIEFVEMRYELDEPNVCVLDYARWKFADDKAFSPLTEVLRADNALRDRIGIERRGGEMLQPWFAKEKYREVYGPVTLEYPFVVEKMPEGAVWIAAERPENWRYSINGVELKPESMDDWWVDNAFVKMRVPEGALKLGENTVTASCDFCRTTNLEAVYVIGAFGVRAKAGASALIDLPETLSLDDTALRGLPFYGGRVTFTLPAAAYRDKIAPEGAVLLKIADFSGALAKANDAAILWEPYTADVTEAVRKGEDLRLTLVNTRRNTFGPLHIVPTCQGAYGPPHFLTEGEAWSDEYARVPAALGILRFMTREADA